LTLQSGHPPESRAPLNRERILHAALELADRAGLDAVSMRRLGQELGVEAMSLYNHVANKDDILRGIFEVVMDEVEPATDEDGWKVGIYASAASAHQTLVRHPWAHEVMMSTAVISPGRMRWMESVLKTLREAGFSVEQSCHAYHALDSHVIGFTLWQASFPAGAELRALAERALSELSPDEFPYAAEHIRHHLVEPVPSAKSEFEFGLDLILDGLERMLDQP
jgi:AcrR family transcriptional regulator